MGAWPGASRPRLDLRASWRVVARPQGHRKQRGRGRRAKLRRIVFAHRSYWPPMIMSDTYVPLISSGTAGPLGVLHLPRLWQKVSLESQGKLAAGYPGIG